jgi:hypothetical protein
LHRVGGTVFAAAHAREIENQRAAAARSPGEAATVPPAANPGMNAGALSAPPSALNKATRGDAAHQLADGRSNLCR